MLIIYRYSICCKIDVDLEACGRNSEKGSNLESAAGTGDNWIGDAASGKNGNLNWEGNYF